MSCDIWIVLLSWILGVSLFILDIDTSNPFLQGRLGPGRLHHCMRLVGAAERGIQIMAERALSRTVFGKLIAEQGSFRSDIAKVVKKLHPF